MAADELVEQIDALIRDASDWRYSDQLIGNRFRVALPAITNLVADNKALRAALERIERRTRKHPDDTADDDRRDKAIAHSIAQVRAALGSPDDGK